MNAVPPAAKTGRKNLGKVKGNNGSCVISQGTLRPVELNVLEITYTVEPVFERPLQEKSPVFKDQIFWAEVHTVECN